MPIPSRVLPGAISGLAVPMHRPEGRIIKQPTNVIKTDYTGDITGADYILIKKDSPEQRFDFEFKHGTELSNGAKLIKPTILSLGRTDITKTDDGNYSVVCRIGGPVVLTEKELIRTKWLARGAILENKDKTYAISYIDRDNQKHVIRSCSKQDAMKILEDNSYHL